MNKHTLIVPMPPNNALVTHNQWRRVADKFRWTNIDFKPYSAPKPVTGKHIVDKRGGDGK